MWEDAVYAHAYVVYGGEQPRQARTVRSSIAKRLLSVETYVASQFFLCLSMTLPGYEPIQAPRAQYRPLKIWDLVNIILEEPTQLHKASSRQFLANTARPGLSSRRKPKSSSLVPRTRQLKMALCALSFSLVELRRCWVTLSTSLMCSLFNPSPRLRARSCAVFSTFLICRPFKTRVRAR